MTNHTWSIEDVYRSNAPTSLESQYAGTYYESDEQNFRKGIKVKIDDNALATVIEVLSFENTELNSCR